MFLYFNNDTEGLKIMRILSARTLYRYTIRLFITRILFIAVMLASLILFFDTIELLRRASDFTNVPLWRILQMSLLRMPDILQTVSPFIILFSGLITLWNLNNKHEISIFRLAGFSVWQFITPLLLGALLVGFFMIGVINPISTIMTKHFNKLERTFLSHDDNEIALFKNGLWLKQPSETGYAIIHAKEIAFPSWHLSNVMSLAFNNTDDLLWRIDAPVASLEADEWVFYNSHIASKKDGTQNDVTIRLKTTLTPKQIEKTFSSTQTISFWQLPHFISIMSKTGFDPSSLQIYFHSMLALPFYFAALILIAACVTLRPPRSQNTFKLIAFGVSAGFCLFFLSNFLKALGASNQIPITVAAWSPVAITTLFGIGILLSLEDG